MSPNILASQITKAERWTKLYRIIHHLFLKNEIVHVEDYKTMLSELNRRIDQLNKKLDANLMNMKVQFDSHIHVAPQAASGVLPTQPPTVPLTIDKTPITPVLYIDTALKAQDSMQMATGPAKAPLSGGSSPDQILADSTIISDIGI
jgi:hypothetical protein